MVEADINWKAQSIPEHWSLFLRCTICFGYLHDPHTLECGHTFCKRCLKRLAEIAREDNPDTRMRRLRLSCPTCRHPFRAKPVLKDHLCTCIVLKHMVELWRRECKLLALSSSSLCLRSICSQTQSETCPDGAQGDLQEEFSERMRPINHYSEAFMKLVAECANDEPDPADVIIPKSSITASTTASTTNTALSRSTRDNSRNSSDSESSFATSDNDGSNISSSHSSVSLPEMFTRFSVPRITFTQCSPGRFLLMAVWCMYSVVIVGLAESFLPYVILFTLFFFLVVLR